MNPTRSRPSRRFAGALACLAAAGLTLATASALPSSSNATPGGLLIADGGFGGVLEMRSHEARVTIDNGIAVTEIDQVFLNTESRIVEALYTFPVPKGASVASFSMWIGGKEMVGEVVEKERAREIYESYKRTRVDPGLLEQVDYKTFEMRIFPIAAGAEQRVRVTYYQELDVDGDWATYVYPLATTTRSDVDTRVHGRFALSLDAKSEVPLVEMLSPSHSADFVMVEHAPGYRQASLELTGADLDRDLVIAFRTERAVTGFDVVTSKEKGEDGYLLLSLTAGKELEELDEGMDYVFVSDVSGSMADDGKLGLSMRSVEAFVDALGPKDRFELMAFNVAASVHFGALTPAGEESLASGRAFLRDQRARGGTNLRPALEAAYRFKDADRQLNVVVLSDGMTEQSEQRELLQLIQSRPSGVRLFCIGVGNEVDRPLLRQVAERSGGLAAFLSHGDDFERQARAFRRKLTRPAMTEVRLSFEGVKVYDVEPAELPNLYHGAPVRLYARYERGGEARVTLKANLLGAPIEESFTLELPEVDDGHPELERMWAWHRVQSLMDDDRTQGSKKRQAEVVRLCEGYSIASEYASFIVLENDGEYRRWKIERKNATRLQRDRAAQAALREQLAELRDRSAQGVGPVESGEATPAAFEAPQKNPGANRRTTQTPAPERNGNGVDIDVRRSSPRRGSSRGGGALGPIGGALALGCALIAMRRRRED